MAGSISSSIASLASLNLEDPSTYHSDFKFASKKPGKDGDLVKIRANFAPVTIKPNTIVLLYNIEISIPDRVENAGDSNIPQRNRIKHQKRIIEGSNFEIFNRFYEEEKKKGNESLFASEPIFDGRKIVYSKTKLNFDGDRITTQVRVKVPEKKFPQKFDITITKPRDAHEIDLSILNNPRNLRSAEKELQALDIIVTYGAKKFNLFFNSNMFLKKSDLIQLRSDERRSIRFDLGNLKEGSFGSYQVSSFRNYTITFIFDFVVGNQLTVLVFTSLLYRHAN